MFVATVFALQRTGRVLVERYRVDRRVVLSLVLTASVFFVVDSASSLYEKPWGWGRQDVVDGVRLDGKAIGDFELLVTRADHYRSGDAVNLEYPYGAAFERSFGRM